MIARNDSTPVIIPRPCSNIAALGDFSRDVVSAIKGLRDRKVIYDVPKIVPLDEFPFKLTARVASLANDVKFQVSSHLSTITDGTIGPSIDLSEAGFDTEYVITATSYIYLEADVDSDLVLTGWILKHSTDPDDAKEIEASGSPIEQIYLRLLIGVVEFDDANPSNPIKRIYQNTKTAQRIVYDFYNGMLVKTFTPCYVHASYRKT